jgi:hypothetical protein
MLPEPISVLMLVADVFECLHIPYLVGGSMASALYGVTRSTLDVDFVVELHQEQVSALVKTLGNDFYADGEMIRDAVRYRSSFNLIHLKTMFKVDVFIRKERSFDKVQFQRRVEQLLATNPEQKAFMTTAEDIILAKLEWYRMGSEVSDRQWRDIVGVLKVQTGRLDMDYLGQWAAELNVTDLLKRALKESDKWTCSPTPCKKK